MSSGTWLALAGLAGITIAVGITFLAMLAELGVASSIATGAYIASVIGFALATAGAKMSSTTRLFIVSLGPIPMAILLMLGLTYLGL
ncbi:hypothetical protein [Pelagibacterium lentulum]|uniref:Uncharacterized protein n=1 Tax=Pelagibacterium lentulum TaxID=2029865 RepID=A0A916W025_9HYPH|nr:hypothetical protein [Pelagibacterium lentulum]GGA56959.1 hypothetical protein GCM10011499_28970 [Pelagibacterium lentulum]